MRQRFQLSNAVPNIHVNLQWEPRAVLVENPTGSPIYVAVGSSLPPNKNNADYTIPAASVRLQPVVGKDFAFALADPAATIVQPILGEDYRGVVLEFLSGDEYVPMFGSMATNSLSQSDQLGGELALLVAPGNTQQYGPFDIGGWGGILINLRPDSTSGFGHIRVLAHHTNIIAAAGELCRFPIWGGAPILLIVPRTLRYIWIEIEPETYEVSNVTGFISARTTLVEILETDFVPAALPCIKTFVNLAPAATWTIDIPTYGLTAIECIIQATSFGGGAAMRYRLETSTDRAKWRYQFTEEKPIADPVANFTYTVNRPEQHLRISVYNPSGNNISGYVAYIAKVVTDPTLQVPTQYFDRNGVARYDGTSILTGPHGTTARVSYSVLSSRKAYCEHLAMSGVRATAATADGLYGLYATYRASPIGGTHAYVMTKGEKIMPIVFRFGPMYGGDSFTIYTEDLSTNGTVKYEFGYKVSQYDVAG